VKLTGGGVVDAPGANVLQPDMTIEANRTAARRSGATRHPRPPRGAEGNWGKGTSHTATGSMVDIALLRGVGKPSALTILGTCPTCAISSSDAIRTASADPRRIGRGIGPVAVVVREEEDAYRPTH